ncbi:MAG: four helix bundle protein [Gemmatimonadetes bacterium]|nr:four helix bundle protein [Gemmatimonadota bacterium]
MSHESPSPIRGYRDLIVWQKAMKLRRRVYLIVTALPPQDRFEIGSQVLRAAVSIPSNIAEGHARLHRQDYKQFLSIAGGSAGELDTQLVAIAQDNPSVLAAVKSALSLLSEVQRMLTAIIKKL